MRGRIQGSGAGSHKKEEENKRCTDSLLLLKVGNTPLLPVGLEIDPRRAQDPLAVKVLEDRLVEPQAPEDRGVEDVTPFLGDGRGSGRLS